MPRLSDCIKPEVVKKLNGICDTCLVPVTDDKTNRMLARALFLINDEFEFFEVVERNGKLSSNSK